MNRATLAVTILFGSLTLIGFAACGSRDDCGNNPSDQCSETANADDGASASDTGGDGAAVSIGRSCGVSGANCGASAECCSGVCDATLHTCTNGLGVCLAGSAACAASTACCSLSCTNGTCSGTQCVSDNGACTNDAECCGGKCTSGACTPLNNACRTAGNSCAANNECCSSLCSNGTCQLAASFCSQVGDVCSSASECCSATCTIAAGSVLGTCGAIPDGAAFCHGVSGTVCGDCNDCCSRLCAPYAPTGVKICQPANGCHVTGDLCQKTSDCCGAAGTGLPGDGNVVCDIDPGKTVGICRNPRSCNPEGNVCHFKDYACSISSARNNCCEHLGSKSNCELDPLGVPRCHAISECRKADETCAFSGDCCDGRICTPGTDGILRCGGQSADGGAVCRSNGETCTINADCCAGTACVVPTGSTVGTCKGSFVSSDGGTCAAYGQACATASDCCNGIPCTNSICAIPAPPIN